MNIDIPRINQVLQKIDPEGLLKMGAPNDEYYSEAYHIAAALYDSSLTLEDLDLDFICSVVCHIFNSRFVPSWTWDCASARNPNSDFIIALIAFDIYEILHGR